MKKENLLHKVGVTVEGKLVMGGLFQMADTHGFPLQCSIRECYRRGWQPGYYDYAVKALSAGWPVERIEARLTEALRENWDIVPRREADQIKKAAHWVLTRG